MFSLEPTLYFCVYYAPNFNLDPFHSSKCILKLQLRELDDLDLEEEDDEEDGVSGFHHQPIPTQPSPQQHIMQRQNLGVAPTVPLPGTLISAF